MARVTYGALVTELRGSVGGTVFQSNAYGFTAKNTPNMSKPNSLAQNVVKNAVFRCTQRWATLDPAFQANWDSYATAFPQYAKHNTSSRLSGYAVFLKRNMIAEIFGGFALDNPDIIVTGNASFTPVLQVGGGILTLTFNPSPGLLGIDSFISMSSPCAPNAPIRVNQLRLVIGSAFGSGAVNLDSQYLAVFGRLPVVGEKVLIKFQNVGDTTGAVYAAQLYTVLVTSL